MQSTTITDRPGPCITLAEARAWLRLDHTADDSLLSDIIIPGAQDKIEQATGLCLSGDTLVVVEVDAVTNDGEIHLPLAPFDEVIDVELDNESIAADDYTITGGSLYPVLNVSAGTKCKIEYLAGFAAANGYTVAGIPPALKIAVLMQTAYDYEHRGDSAIAPEISHTILLHTRNLMI
jgi:uncharacterized phiE125 gp8 family phage protein